MVWSRLRDDRGCAPGTAPESGNPAPQSPVAGGSGAPRPACTDGLPAPFRGPCRGASSFSWSASPAPSAPRIMETHRAEVDVSARSPSGLGDDAEPRSDSHPHDVAKTG